MEQLITFSDNETETRAMEPLFMVSNLFVYEPVKSVTLRNHHLSLSFNRLAQ